jgi:putative component of toxin-antitoxin plasmid stabilization module
MIRVVLFKEDGGSVPVRDFIASVSDKAKVKIIARIDRLRELGHQLRRPEADYLGDGIYELRTRLGHVNFRVLYFFHGNVAAVLSSGFTKEARVPPVEIDRARQCKAKFERSPQAHTFEEHDR